MHLALSPGLFCARLTAAVRVRRAQVTDRKRARREEYVQATRAIMDAFPALRSGSVSKVYKLQRGDFKDMWMTLSCHIARKRRVMEEWAEGVNREHHLIEELRECTVPVREVAIVEELERLQEAERCLAFEDRPDQQAYIKACSYSDVWVRQYDSCGNVVGIVASYYVCLGKFSDQTDCLMLIPSKDWERGPGVGPIECRKWFCTSTRHYKKYNAGWGQIVVIKRFTRGAWETYYMRAKVPTWDKEDIRAMDIEERLCHGAESALEVYRRLERLTPTTDELVVQAENANPDSVRLRSRADLQMMPWLPWDEIYGMVDHVPATKKAKKAAAALH